MTINDWADIHDLSMVGRVWEPVSLKKLGAWMIFHKLPLVVKLAEQGVIAF